MSRFEFATSARILFGPGVIREAGPLAASLGHRALLICGRDQSRAQPLVQILAEAKVETVLFSIPGEPTTTLAQAAGALGRTERCDLVIGFGGGSALDAVKAAAALLTNQGDLFDYLEVVGRAQPLPHPAAPCLAIPTTAGTGAEVTRNAVLASPEHRVKVSLRHTSLLPRVALVDPELTYRLPPALTASTGLDALTQLIEPFVCNRANPMTDGLCREGLTRAARSLRRVYQDGADSAAREDMAVASLFGGLALANAGLGAVHGFAAPIGGMFPAPHGAVCAALLPIVSEINVRALRQRAPNSPALERYAEMARIVTGQANAAIEEGIAWMAQLTKDFGIPKLGAYGITPAHIDSVVEKAARASSMKANPIALTPAELAEALTSATV